jgi:hypothetical protein
MTWTPRCSIHLDRAAQPFYLGLMCGRFTQHLSWAEIHRLADLIGQPRNLAPRFNIAPTTPIEVVRAGEAGNELMGASINPIFLQRLATGIGYVWLLARLRLWFERDVLVLLRSGQRFLGVVG